MRSRFFGLDPTLLTSTPSPTGNSLVDVTMSSKALGAISPLLAGRYGIAIGDSRAMANRRKFSRNYRPAASYVSQDPVKRSAQLANLIPGGAAVRIPVGDAEDLKQRLVGHVLAYCQERPDTEFAVVIEAAGLLLETVRNAAVNDGDDGTRASPQASAPR